MYICYVKFVVQISISCKSLKSLDIMCSLNGPNKLSDNTMWRGFQSFHWRYRRSRWNCRNFLRCSLCAVLCPFCNLSSPQPVVPNVSSASIPLIVNPSTNQSGAMWDLFSDLSWTVQFLGIPARFVSFTIGAFINTVHSALCSFVGSPLILAGSTVPQQ